MTAAIDRFVLQAADGRTTTTLDELSEILPLVAEVGFSSEARERARGRLAGMVWRGTILKGSDRLPPAEIHYLWHVVRQREWPEGTELNGYIESLRAIILDRSSGVYVGRFAGVLQLGVVRESRELRGPGGHLWAIVQYRTDWGHWVTGYQPEAGLSELAKPQWSDISWLLQPRRNNGR